MVVGSKPELFWISLVAIIRIDFFPGQNVAPLLFLPMTMLRNIRKASFYIRSNEYQRSN
jgi:hypothetical protein